MRLYIAVYRVSFLPLPPSPLYCVPADSFCDILRGGLTFTVFLLIGVNLSSYLYYQTSYGHLLFPSLTSLFRCSVHYRSNWPFEILNFLFLFSHRGSWNTLSYRVGCGTKVWRLETLTLSYLKMKFGGSNDIKRYHQNPLMLLFVTLT